MAINDGFHEATFKHSGLGGCPGNWMLDPGQAAPPVIVLIPEDQGGWLGVECGDCGVMLTAAPKGG